MNLTIPLIVFFSLTLFVGGGIGLATLWLLRKR